jgi:hypothetical protein
MKRNGICRLLYEAWAGLRSAKQCQKEENGPLNIPANLEGLFRRLLFPKH